MVGSSIKGRASSILFEPHKDQILLAIIERIDVNIIGKWQPGLHSTRIEQLQIQSVLRTDGDCAKHKLKPGPAIVRGGSADSGQVSIRADRFPIQGSYKPHSQADYISII